MNGSSFAVRVVLFLALCAIMSGCSTGSTRAIDSVVLVEAGRAAEVWSVYKMVTDKRRVEEELAERTRELSMKASRIHSGLAGGTGPSKLSTEGKRQLAQELAAEREEIMTELLDWLADGCP